jgi:hypothetical protein
MGEARRGLGALEERGWNSEGIGLHRLRAGLGSQAVRWIRRGAR